MSDPGRSARAARAFLLTRWASLVVGCALALFIVDGPVWTVLAVLGVYLLGFGSGVLTLASAVAEDLRVMHRHVRRVEGVNRRIVQRASERRRSA